MLKHIDRAVPKILPVLTVERIGSAAQEASYSAAKFVKGQLYSAQVLSKLGETNYQVKIASLAHDIFASPSNSAKDVIVNMALGNSAIAGQKLLLRFMHSSPQPTFLLMSNPTNIAGSVTEMSSAANMITQYLQQAESAGVSSRIQATQVITHQPENVQLMAKNLHQAIASSGLFYESHLANLTQANEALSNEALVAIQLEPQNQRGAAVASLMSQQLAVLENQRLAWQGEVWPAQKMDWRIDLKPPVHDQNEVGRNNQAASQDRPIASELTLDLPHLGKVTAKINLVDGRMRIQVLAEQQKTLKTLDQKKQPLYEAIVKNGQQLEAITLASLVSET